MQNKLNDNDIKDRLSILEDSVIYLTLKLQSLSKEKCPKCDSDNFPLTYTDVGSKANMCGECSHIQRDKLNNNLFNIERNLPINLKGKG